MGGKSGSRGGERGGRLMKNKISAKKLLTGLGGAACRREMDM